MDTIITFTLYATLAALAAQAGGCPENLPDTTAMHERDGFCYQFVMDERYWPSARDYCHKYGGFLVRIPDAEFNDWLLAKLDALPWRNNGIWIGLHDRETDDRFEWDNGDGPRVPLGSFRNWDSGHPGAFWNSKRDCIRIRRKSTWGWSETFCSYMQWKYRFICQYPIERPETPSVNAMQGGRPAHTTPTTTTTTPKTPTTKPTTPLDKTFLIAGSREEELSSREDEEDEAYDYASDDLPLPLARIQDPEERREAGGIIGFAMAGVLLVLLVLLVILIVMRRRRKQMESVDPEGNVGHNAPVVPTMLPSKDALCNQANDEKEHRPENIYVEPPEAMLRNPNVEDYLEPVVDHIYEEPEEVRAKVKVIERDNLAKGGEKVTVMITKDRNSCATYVPPDQLQEGPLDVTAIENEAIEESKKDVKEDDAAVDECPVKPLKEVVNEYLSMSGSTEKILDPPEESYQRPRSPVKQATAQYDTPKPQPVYAEIPDPAPENIYEDLDELKIKRRDMVA